MSMFEGFDTNSQLESEGIWADYGDFRVRLRRAGGGNKLYQKTAEKVMRPYQKLAKANALTNDKSIELLKIIFARAVVADWQYKDENGNWVSGIEDPATGQISAVEEDVLIRVFDAYSDLFDDLVATSREMRNYLTEDDQAAQGNSSTSSSTV